MYSAHSLVKRMICSPAHVRLGDLRNVTLAIYHVKNFGVQRMPDGRVRLGTTGGPGGNDPGNLHSHFEIWNGLFRGVVEGRERFR